MKYSGDAMADDSEAKMPTIMPNVRAMQHTTSDTTVASNIVKDFLQLKYSGDAIADDNEIENPNISDKMLGLPVIAL